MPSFRFLIRIAASCCALATALLPPSTRADALEQARQNGMLSFAVYNDFPPFSDDGKGIDIDLAHALAAKLGFKADIRAFNAGEDMQDDLRNIVWKGHYLGNRTAQVMLHVPVDRIFMARNEQVESFAPYFREQIVLARSLGRLPAYEGPKQPRAAAGRRGRRNRGTDAFLLSAEGGRLRGNVKHFKSTSAAAQALKAGEVAAVMGQRSELQAALAGAAGFELTAVVAPGLAQSGWALGLATKREDTALAHALKRALDALQESGVLAEIFAKHGVTLTAP